MTQKYHRNDIKRYLPGLENVSQYAWYTWVFLRCTNMPVSINGRTYYRTIEVCRTVGISRNTLFRWLDGGIGSEPEYRDWRGWRLITEAQVAQMKARAEQLIIRK